MISHEWFQADWYFSWLADTAVFMSEPSWTYAFSLQRLFDFSLFFSPHSQPITFRRESMKKNIFFTLPSRQTYSNYCYSERSGMSIVYQHSKLIFDCRMQLVRHQRNICSSQQNMQSLCNSTEKCCLQKDTHYNLLQWR